MSKNPRMDGDKAKRRSPDNVLSLQSPDDVSVLPGFNVLAVNILPRML